MSGVHERFRELHPASGQKGALDLPEMRERLLSRMRLQTVFRTVQEESQILLPECNIPAEWVGASNLIPPFWKRLHNFFTYPIARGPLLLIFVCAGLCSLPYSDLFPDNILLQKIALYRFFVSLWLFFYR